MRRFLIAAAFAVALSCPHEAVAASGVFLVGPDTVTPFGTSSFPLVVQDVANGTGAAPTNAVQVFGSGSGTTAATTATLGGAAGKTTYICGFSADATATAAANGNLTVTGGASGTMNYLMPIGASPTVGSVLRTFLPCIPASGQNVAIVVTGPAAGAGGVQTVNVWGFRQ